MKLKMEERKKKKKNILNARKSSRVNPLILGDKQQAEIEHN